MALKVLPQSFSSDADRLARFEREAQVLAASVIIAGEVKVGEFASAPLGAGGSIAFANLKSNTLTEPSPEATNCRGCDALVLREEVNQEITT